VITRAQAEEADYNLSPSRWVGQSSDMQHRSLKELILELSQLDEETIHVDRVLIQMLGRL
jgi:type I restriction enzyme M protein